MAISKPAPVTLPLKAQRVEWGKKDRKNFFCLFSKKGFTEAIIKVAKKEKVVLFKLDFLQGHIQGF